jgi:hypothetical protein
MERDSSQEAKDQRKKDAEDALSKSIQNKNNSDLDALKKIPTKCIDRSNPASNGVVSDLPDCPSTSAATTPAVAPSAKDLAKSCYAAYDAANAVRVRYIVGYGPAATDVPNNIRLWIIARSLAALDKKEPSAWIDRLLDAETVSCAA